MGYSGLEPDPAPSRGGPLAGRPVAFPARSGAGRLCLSVTDQILPGSADTAWRKGHLLSGTALLGSIRVLFPACQKFFRIPDSGGPRCTSESFLEVLDTAWQKGHLLSGIAPLGSIRVLFPACQKFFRTPDGDGSRCTLESFLEVLLPPGRRLGVLLQILDCCLRARGKRGL